MIDRTKDEQYHEMLNNGEMYDTLLSVKISRNADAQRVERVRVLK